jgi:hypothetical protein
MEHYSGGAKSMPSLVQEDIILPEQIGHRRRYTPEQCLLAAVLQQALEDMAEQDEQARRWFEIDDHGRFSLAYLCEHLDLDVDLIRSQARRRWQSSRRSARRMNHANWR